MAIPDPETVLTQIQAALAQNDINRAIRILESLRAPDQAAVFNDLVERDKIALLPQLDPSTSADILEDLEDEEAAELMQAISSDTALRVSSWACGE